MRTSQVLLASFTNFRHMQPIKLQDFVHFDFFGDRANQYPLEVGDTIVLSFDIESREWNGRWFTSIRGWKAEKTDITATSAPTTAPAYQPVPNAVPAPPMPDFSASEGESDDLPF